MNKRTVRDIDVKGKRVLMRVDFNVPINEGRVVDDTRIKAVLPTIQYLLNQGAKVILVSHLGRPKGFDERYRMGPVAESLSRLLAKEVRKVDETVTQKAEKAVNELKEGNVLLLENVRFNPGEKQNDPQFAKKLARLADVYVNDAFGAVHRAHASVVGVPKYLPAVAGFLLESEVNALSKLLENPEKPFFVLLGGSKVSDKIKVINKFLQIVDGILSGGAMCFTFLKARGVNIGKSLCEDEELDHAQEMLKKAERNGILFYLPCDVVVADSVAEDANYKVVPVEKIPDDWIGVDIGPKTIQIYKDVLKKAKTIFWNGPVGVFEIEAFSSGTRAMAEAIAQANATTIVGGGDSDAALRKYGLEDKVSFVSTGGGASLRLLEGTPLPGVEALMDK
ncbi:MAG: phosphoglycerate kinase [Actinomycetota bacterium]|nr:phosphoglycerate kinase [Actinomycetota bacterium]MDI6821690.1 phosphoglycerate kinase [Actinomycetota bacterium]